VNEQWKEQIARINDRLKAANLPVRARLRGKSALTLQATLPLRPEQGIGKKQQEISLGISANKEGLRRIENEAHILARHLINGTFQWHLYPPQLSSIAPKTTQEMIERFKSAYMSANAIKESTWCESWQRTFDRLPKDEPLSEASMLAVILLTEAHSRNRELTCQRLQRLADFAELGVDFKAYKGNYSDASLTPRDIPSDDLIMEWRDRIPNAQWRWVFGMMAAFGLRPHECFFCEFISPRTLHILEGKTDFHITRPLLPEWIERWDLINVKRPKVKGKTYRDYGQRTGTQFDRYQVPFNPYDLRHAYAIRGIVESIPVQIMAGMMGHSVAVHTRTYNRWLKDAVAERVYEERMAERQAERRSK
jgi:integrase